jgi:hypothetical protein
VADLDESAAEEGQQVSCGERRMTRTTETQDRDLPRRAERGSTAPRSDAPDRVNAKQRYRSPDLTIGFRERR